MRAIVTLTWLFLAIGLASDGLARPCGECKCYMPGTNSDTLVSGSEANCNAICTAANGAYTGTYKSCRPPGTDCAFYQDIDRNLKGGSGCGLSGYPLGYGKKYCDRFACLKIGSCDPKFNSWIDQTTTCLQFAMESALAKCQPLPPSCNCRSTTICVAMPA